jgi:hypothetical protein
MIAWRQNMTVVEVDAGTLDTIHRMMNFHVHIVVAHIDQNQCIDERLLKTFSKRHHLLSPK